MSLEDEALKDAGTPQSRAPSPTRPPRTFDRFIRVIATLLLVGILTVMYWIPLELMNGYIAAALVLAVLTILGAGLASRLYHLRVRVQALEAVLDDEDRRREHHPPTQPEIPAKPPLEEIQNQP